MAHLAEQLGREFEARAFLVISIADEPGRDDLRRDLRGPSQAPAASAGLGQTLAEVIDVERDDRG